MVATAKTDTTAHGATSAHGAPEHHDDTPERDPLAHTIPLLSLWAPMLVVVGLVIVTGYTTSDFALGGAVAALLIATYVVVYGTIRLASAPPERDGERPSERDEEQLFERDEA